MSTFVFQPAQHMLPTAACQRINHRMRRSGWTMSSDLDRPLQGSAHEFGREEVVVAEEEETRGDVG